MNRQLPVAFAASLLALGLAACGSGSGGSDDPTSTTIRVGASPVPHAEILEYVKDNLAEEAGIDLEVVEFTDYIQPNEALKDGSIDANFFQHVPYLDEQIEARGYDFTALVPVHLEPLGIYSSRLESLDDVPDGAVVAIPNDPTNGARALELLQANDLITLADTGEASPTVSDVAENPKDLDIVEIEAAQIPRSLEDASLGVINGNYAIEAGLDPATDALALESADENPYANVLVVRTEDAADPGLVALGELLQSPEVRQFITDGYQGAVIPAT